MKVTLIAIAIYLYICVGVAIAGPKKIKVYVEVNNQAYSESYAAYIRQWMRIKDDEDKSYEFIWVVNAIDAEYRISPLMGIDKDNCSCKNPERELTRRYFGILHLWKKGSDRSYELITIRLGCDPNGIAEEAVNEMLRTMGLAKPDSLTKK